MLNLSCVLAVQHECIPQAILGMDVICQAKSGMGKTAVFVLSVLQQLEPVDKEVAALIICHTRELAYQVRPCFLPDPRSCLIVKWQLSEIWQGVELMFTSYCRSATSSRDSARTCQM